MKKLICLCMLLCNIAASHAQSTETDSLKQVLATAKEDTTRVLVLEGLSFAYQYSYPDTALHYALQGLQLAKKINFLKGEGYCINALGNVYFDIGNYPRALELYLQALKIRERLNSQREIAVTYSNIGSVYAEQGDNRQALQYITKTKMVDAAIKDSGGLLINLYNIGSLYQKLKDHDSALFFQQQAYQVAVNTGDEDYIGAIMNAFGDIYNSLHKLPVAMDYYRKGIVYASDVKDQEVISSANYGVADIFHQMGAMDSAIFYAARSLSSAQKASFLKHVMAASLLLSGLFKKTHHVDSALYYHELTMAVKDSLFNTDKIKQIQNLAYNEKLRQDEIAEQKLQERIERRDSLQLIGIAVFIVIFLFIVVALGRRKKQPRFTEFLAVLGLLLLFEFISFLIHPYIAKLTNHTPVYYLLASVILAVTLARLHHHTTVLIKGRVLKHPFRPAHQD